MKTWLTETLHWCLVNKLSVTLRLLIFIFFLFIVIYYFVFCFPYKLKLIQDPIWLWSKLQSCQPDLDEAVSESAAGLTGRRPHRPDRQERAQHQHWHERPRPAHPVLHTHTHGSFTLHTTALTYVCFHFSSWHTKSGVGQYFFHTVYSSLWLLEKDF